MELTISGSSMLASGLQLHMKKATPIGQCRANDIALPVCSATLAVFTERIHSIQMLHLSSYL
jgi:hypothetical protein